MAEFTSENLDNVVNAIKNIPESELRRNQNHYITQSGQCAVWVEEKLEPGFPLVLDGKITFPYHIDRPNHRYNCTDRRRDSRHTTAPVKADIDNKVTADYKIANGKLIISNIVDHGKTEETIGGGAIVRQLQVFS